MRRERLTPAASYIRRLSPAGRAAQLCALRRIASWWKRRPVSDPLPLRWETWTYRHSARLRDFLGEHYAPASGNRMLSALRGTLRECWRLGLLSWDDCQRASDVASFRFRRMARGRLLTAAELGQLFAAAGQGDRTGARDVALLALLYAAGLRRKESASVQLADLDQTTGSIRVTGGKGCRERTAHLGHAIAQVSPWLVLRGAHPGPLVCLIDREGRVLPDRPMSTATVGRLVARAGERAGLGLVRPHDLRRSFASHLLAHGGDVFQVQRLLGHADVSTTALYDVRGDDAAAALQRQLPLPAPPRRADRRLHDDQL